MVLNISMDSLKFDGPLCASWLKRTLRRFYYKEGDVVYRLPTSHPYDNNEPTQPACVSANNMSAML